MKVLVVTRDGDGYTQVEGVVPSLESATSLVKSLHDQKSLVVSDPRKTENGYEIAAIYRGGVESYELQEFEVALPPEGREQEQHLELASALERELVRKVIKEVEPLTEGWQAMFHAGAGLACEEILYRLEILWGEREDVPGGHPYGESVGSSPQEERR